MLDIIQGPIYFNHMFAVLVSLVFAACHARVLYYFFFCKMLILLHAVYVDLLKEGMFTGA